MVQDDESVLLKEYLYYYAITLKVGLSSIKEYNIWLDNIFLNEVDNEFLVELEFSSNDINSTIHIIKNLIDPNISRLDFDFIGKLLFKAFEVKYHQDSCILEDLAHQAYSIWNILPHNIANKEPFYTLCYIDDPISYGDEKQTRELFHKLFNYHGGNH